MLIIATTATIMRLYEELLADGITEEVIKNIEHGIEITIGRFKIFHEVNYGAITFTFIDGTVFAISINKQGLEDACNNCAIDNCIYNSQSHLLGMVPKRFSLLVTLQVTGANDTEPIYTGHTVYLTCHIKHDICAPCIEIRNLDSCLNGLLHTPYLALYNNVFDKNYYNDEVIVLYIYPGYRVDLNIDEETLLNSFPNLLILSTGSLERSNYRKIPIIFSNNNINAGIIPAALQVTDNSQSCRDDHPIAEQVRQMKYACADNNKFITEFISIYKNNDLIKNAYK